MKTDEWNGCYPSRWKGMIVEGAIAHPAKFSSRLITRIYEHMIAEGWLRPGDLVLDPFGGVALGAFEAMRHGLRWRGVELEAKFASLGNDNIALWNKRFKVMPHWCQDAALVQGDSRHLLEVLARHGRASEYGGEEIPPPYSEDALGHAGQPNEIDAKKKLYSRIGEGSYSVAAQKIAAAMSSPPYSEARIGQESGQEQCGHGDQYGATEGQLGAMKGDDFAGAIASPPFRQSEGGMGKSREGTVISDALYARHRAGNGAGNAYGETAGQMANMDDGDFNATVTSPPYTGNMQVEKNSKSIGREQQWKTYRASGGGMSFEAFCEQQERHSHGYGNAEGQMGNMPEGAFDEAVSSPPFEKTVLHDGGPVEQQGGELHSDYGQTEGNIGNDQGDSFWHAARTIVEQVYIALRPGGHAVWVVKGFVKNKQVVDFPGQWRQLCEAVGFVTVHEHHAMLTNHKGTSLTLDGGQVEHKTEAKSFFRRNGENKARAAKWWEEATIPQAVRDVWIASARKIKEEVYRADLREYDIKYGVDKQIAAEKGDDIPEYKPPRRPSEAIILAKAQSLAWADAGSPEVEIATSIDFETVLCMVKEA